MTMASRYLHCVVLLLLVGLGSCKKLVEDKKRNVLIEAMTDGTWFVYQYDEGTVNVTEEFTGYNFQFYENGTVTSIKGSEITQGTWVGDVDNYSINSNFPSATNPLLRLNGTWKITDSYSNYVEAEMNTSAGKNILHLKKNE